MQKLKKVFSNIFFILQLKFKFRIKKIIGFGGGGGLLLFFPHNEWSLITNDSLAGHVPILMYIVSDTLDVTLPLVQILLVHECTIPASFFDKRFF